MTAAPTQPGSKITRDLAARVDRLLVMPEDQVADLVAAVFGWRKLSDLAYSVPPPKGVHTCTRGLHPLRRADDDRLALRFIQKRCPDRLPAMASALHALAQAYYKRPIDPGLVPVYMRRGDYSRALILIGRRVL